MDSGKSREHEGGVGFLSLLAIVFIVLKLTHVIDWSWWWVTAPLWGGFAVVAVFLFVIGATALVVAVFEYLQNR